MTDLEQHVAADGRAELVKQVRSKINELKIDYIYFQFVSVTGRIVGKGIPAAVRSAWRPRIRRSARASTRTRRRSGSTPSRTA